ncbi:MAG TPA: head GIN domain-containing protein [Anaerolineales bacterium]|nr:head GIN domain-containing protein [Anaerolineales bacterium]
MNTRYIRTILLVLAIFVVGAYYLHIVRGSGNVILESWKVNSFDHIVLSGSGVVIITQNGEESLRVETDDNVMEYIKADVKDGTLHIGFNDGINMISTTRLIFYVGVDNLNSLTILGSGNIETKRLEANRLKVEIYGSGNVQVADMVVENFETDIYGSGSIQLAGEVDTQIVTINGSGKYLAGEVCSKQVSVWVNGSGDSMICALDMLEVIITGSGSVKYYNNPMVNFSGFGSGSLLSLGKP